MSYLVLKNWKTLWIYQSIYIVQLIRNKVVGCIIQKRMLYLLSFFRTGCKIGEKPSRLWRSSCNNESQIRECKKFGQLFFKTDVKKSPESVGYCNESSPPIYWLRVARYQGDLQPDGASVGVVGFFSEKGKFWEFPRRH